MFWKKYLFNVRVQLDPDTCKDYHLARKLSGKVISIREDGVISMRARRKLPTYDAELDIGYPSYPHLDFVGENLPIVQPVSSSKLMRKLFPEFDADARRALMTAPIIKTESGEYKLNLQRVSVTSSI